MRPPIRDVSSASGELSRDEVRRQFLAACMADDGSVPPSIDVLIAPFAEPERSALRDELEALQRSYAHPTKPDSGNDTRGLDPAGTSEFVAAPGGTMDFAPAPGGTMDFAPAPGGTMDFAPAPGGTMDFAPSAGGPADPVIDVKRGRAGPLPESVAGYEIVGVLGRGAMGVVYKARQRGLKRFVALKMILSGEHASALDLGRFQAEANAVAQLQHPGIIQIFEVGEDAQRPFFSLEFVDGISLHKKIQGTPLPPREAAELLKQMAEAMQYAHARGIVHRDLKPANVLLTADGVPKIGDFGLAKQIGDDESGLTRTGTVLGTPSYMSPEQAEGRLAEVGPLADVYSLGAILYDMLTGRPPFRGTSVLDTLEQLRTREPVPPMQFQPGVPRDLETICLKCLQKDRTKRYGSAGELAADIGRFLRGEPIVARPISTVERTVRWCRRNKGKTAVIAGFLFLAVFYAVSATVAAGWLQVAYTAEAESAAEATKQKTIALAKQRLAEKREEQRQTATLALLGTAEITDGVINLLQNRRLSIGANAEIKKLRAQALDSLREQLEKIGRRFQTTATGNAELVNAQLIGDRFKMLGLSQKARETFEVARKLALAHVEKDPDSDKARANLGIIELRLGDVALVLEGDARLARAHYLEARRLHEEIQRQPKSHDYTSLDMKRILSADDMHVGRALVALGQSTEARRYFQEALQLRQEWSQVQPKNNSPRGLQAEAQLWLGIAGWHVGDTKAASASADAALAICRDLLKQFPKSTAFHVDAAEVLGARGDLLLRLGKTSAAQRDYQEALDQLKVALAKYPDAIEHQPLLARIHERLGNAALLLKQGAAAKEQFKLARQLRDELWDIDRANLARKAGFVLALARNGERTDAMRLATAIRPQMAKSTELTLQVARAFAVLAAHDKVGDRKNRTAALAALTAATDKDYHDAATLETDPDLLALRSEPAFQQLVARIKAR